jgi:hypothetical protein
MAYQAGREARRSGIPYSANPFTFGPDQAMWAEGWRDSDAMLRALGLV